MLPRPALWSDSEGSSGESAISTVALPAPEQAQLAEESLAPAPETKEPAPEFKGATAVSDTGATVRADERHSLIGTLATWADEAGWPAATRGVLACLVHRESRGDTSAHNGNEATGDDSWGILQINIRGNLLPGRLALLRSLGYEVWSRDEAAAVLVQPVANLRMGLLLSGGGFSFGPWAWACGGG